MGILDGKAVVITGAGRGLGEAYAMHAALAGASVVVNDNDGDLAERVAEHIRGYGGRAVASTHTVADPSEAAKIVDLCVDEFGRIDGLVNNAGLNYESLPWEDDPETIKEVVEVNVLGVIYVGIAAMRAMRAVRWRIHHQHFVGSVVRPAQTRAPIRRPREPWRR